MIYVGGGVLQRVQVALLWCEHFYLVIQPLGIAVEYPTGLVQTLT